MRPIDELTGVADPAWRELSRALAASERTEVLDVDRTLGEQTLVAIQATAASTLGALALHTGGVVLDRGWVRLYGGGGAGLVDLAAANGDHGHVVQPGLFEIGIDVLGGRFAINGGALALDPGEVAHWRADGLAWSGLGVGYSEFVAAAIGEQGLDALYEELRWPGWQSEVAGIGLDQGLSVYPPLCMAESRPIEAASRRAISMADLVGSLVDLANQFS